jgi:cytochrome b6-f complex iron-sulfur subunit
LKNFIHGHKQENFSSSREDNMDRRDFLMKSMTGAAVIAVSYCIGGCSSPTAPSPPSNVNLTLNLSDAGNAALLSTGGSIYTNGLIVINAGSGTYRAFSQVCTHQGTTVEYQSGSNLFYCPAHGSEFSSSNGSVLRGPAGSALKQYSVTLSGNSLHITG